MNVTFDKVFIGKLSTRSSANFQFAVSNWFFITFPKYCFRDNSATVLKFFVQIIMNMNDNDNLKNTIALN